MPKEVQCVNCGYLAIRNSQTGELSEANVPTRERGKLSIFEEPACFRLASNITKSYNEFVQKGLLDPDQNPFFETVKSDRWCDEFTDYIQGFSPREHLEMQWLRDVQYEQNQLRKDAERRERFSIGIALVALLVSIIALLKG